MCMLTTQNKPSKEDCHTETYRCILNVIYNEYLQDKSKHLILLLSLIVRVMIRQNSMKLLSTESKLRSISLITVISKYEYKLNSSASNLILAGRNHG